MEHLLVKGPLLDKEGNLVEAGFAYSLEKEYRRKEVRASKWRLKEWDYYYVGNASFGLALTIADNGYMDLLSITLLDFERKTHLDTMKIGLFSFGKLDLPETSASGITRYERDGNRLSISVEDGKRHIEGEIPYFGKTGKTLKIDFTLRESLEGKSLVIATPFRKKKHFYYNQKINCLLPEGGFFLGEEHFDLSQSLGVLDWGRGVWTYKNTWYWSSLSARLPDGTLLGWNLGYGFGDTSKASENLLYIGKDSHKLEKVKFLIPGEDKKKERFLEPWTIEGSGLHATFTPTLNRHSDINLLLLRSKQDQVFGLFSGTYVDPEGKETHFENLPGFAEKVFNKW